jgi:hypothetical protein
MFAFTQGCPFLDRRKQNGKWISAVSWPAFRNPTDLCMEAYILERKDRKINKPLN